MGVCSTRVSRSSILPN
ncbi:hypothetical protein F383_17759 [Gossypium arboreum]|uniref:Uncharacterized protein n=1 Tax=Gossypium arboreum TaxID=29729 RepID=A0A0B0MLU8_GOSAR|nr:hypothetical protein F383_17759 [Gossypium arboreum]